MKNVLIAKNGLYSIQFIYNHCVHATNHSWRAVQLQLIWWTLWSYMALQDQLPYVHTGHAHQEVEPIKSIDNQLLKCCYSMFPFVSVPVVYTPLPNIQERLKGMLGWELEGYYLQHSSSLANIYTPSLRPDSWSQWVAGRFDLMEALYTPVRVLSDAMPPFFLNKALNHLQHNPVFVYLAQTPCWVGGSFFLSVAPWDCYTVAKVASCALAHPPLAVFKTFQNSTTFLVDWHHYDNSQYSHVPTLTCNVRRYNAKDTHICNKLWTM